MDVVAEVERARVEGEADGAGEHDDELQHRWPGIGAARRACRDEGRPSERGRGACAPRRSGSARRRPGAAGQGDAVR
jgi:hypothetical protein